MKILQIASGSKGNSTFIELQNNKILIDCGITKKRIEAALSLNGYNLSDIDSILLTHEHIDHVSSLQAMINSTKAIIYLTRGTYEGLRNYLKGALDLDRVHFIKEYEEFYLNNTKIIPIETFHDALEPVGFKIEDNDSSLVYITDTGYVHNESFKYLSDADAYIFEANHDPDLLLQSSRPYRLKMRIIGDSGHLSNEDSAYLIANLVGPKTKYVMWAHISEECNLNEIIAHTANKVFKTVGTDVSYINFIYLSQIVQKIIEI